jgi:hypothetical protein
MPYFIHKKRWKTAEKVLLYQYFLSSLALLLEQSLCLIHAKLMKFQQFFYKNTVHTKRVSVNLCLFY